jgi:ABC-2 type transport system ATP-binding protein
MRDASTWLAAGFRYGGQAELRAKSLRVRLETSTAIEVSELLVVRGGTVVLDGLSLSVARGCVTGLLGPSGSGKSTLMRSIVGVQRVAGGSITILGVSAGAATLRRRIGYLTQAPSVYVDLSVRENLTYFARIVDAPRSRVDAVLDTVGLTSLSGRPVGRLSGGERARASLAAALLADPEVLVLDEPTVGLDPVLRRDLWDTFHRLAAGGTTLLVSSHVMDEADRCDQLLLLREGRLLAIGTPDDLRRRTGAASLDAAFLRLIEVGA